MEIHAAESRSAYPSYPSQSERMGSNETHAKDPSKWRQRHVRRSRRNVWKKEVMSLKRLNHRTPEAQASDRRVRNLMVSGRLIQEKSLICSASVVSLTLLYIFRSP